jgi:hypothetical protein
MRSAQIAIRDAQRAYAMYRAAKLAGAPFDPLMAVAAGVEIATSALTTYEQTVGTY